MTRIARLLPLSLGLLLACDGADPTASDPRADAPSAAEVTADATFTIDIQPVALLDGTKQDRNVVWLDRPFVTVAAIPLGGFDVTRLTAAGVYFAEAGVTASELFFHEVHTDGTGPDCGYADRHYPDLDDDGIPDLAVFHFATAGMAGHVQAGDRWCIVWEAGEYCAEVDAVMGGDA